MADHTSSHTTETKTGSGSTGLAFIVGALVVVVAVLAYFMFGGTNDSDDLTITVEGAGSAVEGAAAAVEGAADSSAGAVENATD